MRWEVAKYFAEGGGQNVDISSCRESDFAILYSLMVLSDSTTMTNPTWNRNDVRSAKDVCTRKRIKCGDGWNVTYINFNDVKLSGTVPLELSWLRHLEWLQLCSNTALTGTIPTQVGLLSNLEDLQVQSTSLSGTIPTEIGEMKSLRRFFLYSTLLTGSMPKELCSLPNVSTLKADCRGGAHGLSCSCCTNCQN